MSNPKFRVYIDVEVINGTSALTAKEHAAEVERNLRNAIGNGLLTGHDPSVEIEEYSIRSKVLSEGLDPLIPAGTRVQVLEHNSKPGEGLSYPAQEGVLLEDCISAGWDVVELEGGVSVYAFSVRRLEPQEEKMTGVSPSGLPSPELLRQWAKDPNNELCWGLDRLADLLESFGKRATHNTPTGVS